MKMQRIAKRKQLAALILFGFLSQGIAQAMMSVDANFFYFTDSLTASSTSGTTDLFFDVAIMTSLNRAGDLVVGWNYGSYSIAESGTSSTTFTATEMGPRFGYYIDRKMEWSFFATYNLQTEATYQTTSSETWRGSSYKVEFGYSPEVFDETFVGGKIIYYSATYTEKLVGSTTFSTVSYTRSLIYPALMMSFRW